MGTYYRLLLVNKEERLEHEVTLRRFVSSISSCLFSFTSPPTGSDAPINTDEDRRQTRRPQIVALKERRCASDAITVICI